MNFSIPNTGAPGPTTRIAGADTVKTLSSVFTNANGAPAIGAILTCETENLRFTLGGNIVTPTYPPTQGAAALGHLLYSGQSLVLQNGKQVRTFQFINAVAQADGVLQVTPMFEVGA